ncbi:unnamed protein product [Musa acuminata var. zebrina]
MLLMRWRMISRSGMNAGACRRSRYLFDEMLEITYLVFVHAKY